MIRRVCGIIFLSATAADHGLVDLQIPKELHERPIREVIMNQLVRDRAFRHNVIDKAYGGRCAFTGLAMRNGRGRAEVDAAHIRPVAAGGPDVVQNGLAISKTLHWAFDRGLISAADDGTILKVDRGIPDGVASLFPRDGRLLVPTQSHQRPHRDFLA
jgi:putative restriction endonuclease